MTTTSPRTETAVRTTTSTLLAGLILSVVAFQLNATMLNPAVQHMQNELSATTAQIAFTTAMFFLSKAIFQVFMPRLSDMVGRRRILLISLGILTVGTVISMLAPTVGWLYLGRAIQGACGPVFTIALLTLREATRSEKEYGTKMGIIIAINGGIAGVDVILGGWMADHWGFRSILVFALVATIIAFVAALRWVPESAPSKGEKMDWLGVVLITIVVIGLTWAVGGDPFGHRFPSTWSIGYGIAAIVAGLLFVAHQRRSPNPLIPSNELGNRAIWAMPLTTILTLTGVMAIVNLLVPSFAQNPTAGWGMSATSASLLFMAPYALVGWLVGPFAGRMAPRVGYVRLLQVGILSSAAIVAAMVLVGMHNAVVFGVLIFALGITYGGITNVMLNGLGVLLSPSNAPGLLPGLNGASFGIGAGLSFTILGQAITSGSAVGSSSTGGYSTAMWISICILAAAWLVTLALPAPSIKKDS